MSRKLYTQLRGMHKEDILKLALERCPHGHTYFEHPACLEQKEKFKEKIGYLDIETTNLNASFGFIISYCIKELNGPILSRVITEEEIRSKTKDKDLVESLINDMRKFTRVITYYGVRFDIPFMRTRAVKWGLDFPLFKEILHTDVYFMLKHRFKIHSNRLEAVCDFFDIPSKDHKLRPDIWQDAMFGHKKALDYILTHNKEDVISLEALHKIVTGYSNNNKTSI